MIKLLLASIAVFMSFSSVAAEEIDLTQDAMYYCADTISGAIQDNEVTSIVLRKYKLKIKDKQVSFIVSKNLKVSSLGESVFRLLDDTIFLATMNGDFYAKAEKGAVTYFLYYSLFIDNDINQYISQGTCTKW